MLNHFTCMAVNSCRSIAKFLSCSFVIKVGCQGHTAHTAGCVEKARLTSFQENWTWDTGCINRKCKPIEPLDAEATEKKVGASFHSEIDNSTLAIVLKFYLFIHLIFLQFPRKWVLTITIFAQKKGGLSILCLFCVARKLWLARYFNLDIGLE